MTDKPATAKAWAVIGRLSFIPGCLATARSDAMSRAVLELDSSQSWLNLSKEYGLRVARVTITEDR